MADVEVAAPVEEATVPVTKATEEDEKPAVVEEKIEDEEEAAVNGGTLTKLERNIIHQIQYYFGDANLGRDKFLQEQIGKDNGWVPVSVLLTFKRLSSLSSDANVIVDAIAKSDEGLVEISEDREKLRRHPERPLPEQNEEYRKEVMSRTAYVKGFPQDTEMSDLIEFFAPFQKVTNIAARKYHDKATKKYIFKGSVYVTFSKAEERDEMLKKEKLEYKGIELEKKTETEHHEEKQAEKAKFDKKRNKNKQQEPDKQIVLPKGTIILLEGFTDGINREDIREKLGGLEADVAYIEFNMGDKQAYVRLTEENTAKTLFDKFEDGKLKIKDNELTAKLIEGDEEKEYLENAVNNMFKKRQQGNNRGRRHGGGGHHHGGRNNRKRRGSGDDGPPAKQ